MHSLVLASFSPRRKQLLSTLNIPFIVEASDIEEILNEDLSLEERLIDLAYQKASHVFKNHIDDVVIGCDTTCVLDKSIILGKPKDRNDAFNMIKAFSNHKHQVYSSLCVISKDKIIKKLCMSEVYFKDLSDDLINEYLDVANYQDKAGAYGIQDDTSKMIISHYTGDINTIIGLPLDDLKHILKDEFNIEGL